MRSFLILTILALVGISSGFISPVQRAHVVKAASPTFILQMAEEPPKEDPVDADGTFYDDEVDLTPVKPVLSNSMRDRLIAEASSGLDAEQKQTNVILYIGVAIAILVALGGQGILY